MPLQRSRRRKTQLRRHEARYPEQVLESYKNGLKAAGHRPPHASGKQAPAASGRGRKRNVTTEQCWWHNERNALKQFRRNWREGHCSVVIARNEDRT